MPYFTSHTSLCTPWHTFDTNLPLSKLVLLAITVPPSARPPASSSSIFLRQTTSTVPHPLDSRTIWFVQSLATCRPCMPIKALANPKARDFIWQPARDASTSVKKYATEYARSHYKSPFHQSTICRPTSDKQPRDITGNPDLICEF